MKIAVIGLGVLGKTICKELFKNNVEVLAIDSDMEIINQALEYSTNAVKFDATDTNALRKFNLQEYDYVIVCIGDNFEVNVLVTAELKELGVKRVISRASSQRNKKILQKIGADEVYIPENQFGKNLAHRLINNRIVDIVMLNKKYSIAEIITPKRFIGKRIMDLNLRRDFKVNVVTIRKSSEEDFILDREQPVVDHNLDVIELPTAETLLTGNEILVIVGANEDVALISKEN